MRPVSPDSTKTAPVSIRLTQELNAQVMALAEAYDRPKSWIIEKAVQDYVAWEKQQLAAIAEGIRDAEAGRFVPHEAVVAWMDSWGTENELPMPTCK